MILRKLAIRDSRKMLEWMMDPIISQSFRFDTTNIQIEQVIEFIEKSLIDNRNLHLAIADDNDEYLGTISLKNINLENYNAEYAIALRKKAIGTNIAQKATDTILYIAFFEIGLHKVYLNVLSENTRAIRFYEKYGFTFEGEFMSHLKINGEYKDLKWYGIFRTIFVNKKANDFDHIVIRYNKDVFKKKERNL